MNTTRLPHGSTKPAVTDMLYRAMHAHRAGNLAEAETLYNRVLTHDRRQFDALNMLGILNAERRNYAAAARLIERALKVNPRSAEAYANLGRVQWELGYPQRAEASYATAIEIKGDFPLAHSNFSIVLRSLGRPQEALVHCDSALALEPNYPDALTNRGNALFDLDRLGEALIAYDAALRLAPGMSEGWVGRGNVHAELQRHEEAFAAYRQALNLNPNSAAGWLGYAKTLAAFNRNDDAIVAFDRAIAIDPTLKYVEGARLLSKLRLCDWSNFDAEQARLLANVDLGRPAAFPFLLIGLQSSSAIQLKCARAYIAERRLPPAKPLPNRGHYTHSRINVAYLSADFREHPVSYLIAGLIEKHDRSRFRTIAISIGAGSGGNMRARLKGAFEVFVDAGDANSLDLAGCIRAQEIDILVDLMGFTQNARTATLAQRPAPIQAAFLGYTGTTGADFIDYLIADRVVIPPDQQRYYSEKIVYLPDCFMATDNARPIASHISSRTQLGLPDDCFVFCCFGQCHKILPPLFDVWMRLLRTIDNSVIWMLDDSKAIHNLRREAERRGVAGNRIVLAPRVEQNEDHLARMRCADLFLDTFPYNAHSTTSEALWAGLPVVTCMGDTFASRVAASLLHAIGLPELATTQLAEYEALALKLAREPALLGAAKTKLLAHRTSYPLFDTDRFRRHIEAAYATMFDRYRHGQPPASFGVAPSENETSER